MSINRATWPNPSRWSRPLSLWFCLLLSLRAAAAEPVVTGAERTEAYVPTLEGKRVGILTNHTGRIGRTHIVDSLFALGVDLKTIFAPEHGFRGEADAGEAVSGSRDARTGIDIVSVYGTAKQPSDEQMSRLDVVLFDIQDVGLRFYTYLSSMHYMMRACAVNGVKMVVLDRPNPNGFLVDGPILEPGNRSFVGMHPIPVFHGMTLGELARMINAEGWLGEGLRCDLEVVPCLNYTHRTLYRLPVAPSPNLPNMRAVYLYGSLCFFEGTPVSLGRGTDFPFQVFGHPGLEGTFEFTPRSTPGAKNPPLKGVLCHGRDLRKEPSDETVRSNGLDLSYLIECYRTIGGVKFFTPFFDKLTGADYVREMITAGASADRIRERWSTGVERFKQQRKPYLLYDE